MLWLLVMFKPVVNAMAQARWFAGGAPAAAPCLKQNPKHCALWANSPCVVAVGGLTLCDGRLVAASLGLPGVRTADLLPAGGSLLGCSSGSEAWCKWCCCTCSPLLRLWCCYCCCCCCRAREELRRRTNLSTWQDKPIVAVVSRLTPQKGVHLIKHAAYKV
jgi:glycosyltransferase involved in cell wall biosynthesis